MIITLQFDTANDFTRFARLVPDDLVDRAEYRQMSDRTSPLIRFDGLDRQQAMTLLSLVVEPERLSPIEILIRGAAS